MKIMRKTAGRLPIEIRLRLRLELAASKRIIFLLTLLNKSIFKRSIEVAERGFRVRSTFFVTHNAGLFAIASGVFWDLSNLKGSVKKINSRFGCGLYKNRPFQNVWPLLFSQPDELSKIHFQNQSTGSFVEFWKCQYSTLPAKELNFEARKFLTPSSSVLDISKALQEEYSIDFTKLIGVHYRGTDKYLEIPVAEMYEWEKAIARACEHVANPQVLILSDDFEIINHFKDKFKGSFSIDKLTPGSGGIGAHFIKKTNAVAEAQIFLAIVQIISKSLRLITHTGNGALWEVIYRGEVTGVEQLRGTFN
jgi:hypothetical protein